MNKTKRVIAAAAGAVALMGLGAAAVGAPRPERAAAPEVAPAVAPQAPADWEGDSPVPGPEERAMMEPAWRQQETYSLLAAEGVPDGFVDVYGGGVWEADSLVLYCDATADPHRVAEFLAAVERARQGGGPHGLVVREASFTEQELAEWAWRASVETALQASLGLTEEVVGAYVDVATGCVVLLFEGAVPSVLPKRIAGPGTPRLGAEGSLGRAEDQPGPDIG